ncbi:hypothetical protein [Methanosphaera sp. WGK6]|uniref:hypothetical protein n=1 Tax=Methanosphaera sp. WGK6 TaxID=1561964 RepID=UPI00084C333B|nr:hypothetical protein [Methanosphaera sp. WGK6]
MTSTTILPTLMITISIINIVLCLILAAIYFKSYHKIKIKFTLGLIIFALLLLISNIFDLRGVLFMITNNIPLQTIYMHEGVIKLIALLSLFHITIRN